MWCARVRERGKRTTNSVSEREREREREKVENRERESTRECDSVRVCVEVHTTVRKFTLSLEKVAAEAAAAAAL